MSACTVTKQQDQNTQRESSVKLLHCLGLGARVQESLNYVPLGSPNGMLDFPGGILCGKEGDSGPTWVECVSRWPRSGRQNKASEPGRRLNTNRRGQGKGGSHSKASKWKARRKWREWEVPRVCWYLQRVVTKDYYGDWERPKEEAMWLQSRES